MANPAISLTLLLPLLIATAAAANTTGFGCPPGDTNCYVTVQRGSPTNSAGDPCGSSGFKPLTRKMLGYLQASAAMRASLNATTPVVIAQSPGRTGAPQTVCWAGRRNASFSAALTTAPPLPTPPTGPPSSSQDRLKVATVMAADSVGSGGKSVVVTLVDPVSVHPLMCEAPLSVAASLATNSTIVAAYVCYVLLGTCYFATRTPSDWQTGNFNGCPLGGRLALAKDANEETLIRSFVVTLNSSTEYYIQAQECSPEYLMPFSNETLTDFVEPLVAEKFRVTRFPACVRIDISNGSLTMEQNCSLSNWLCYLTIPMSWNGSMCSGSYCHTFWNFGVYPVPRSSATERCPAALPGMPDLKELMIESNFIPVDGPTPATYTYHTGIQKRPLAERTFYLNENTTTGRPLEVFVQNVNENLRQHCLQVHANSSHALGVFAVNCDSSTNATMLFCQYPNGTMRLYSASVYLSFEAARTQCKSICSTFNCHLPTLLQVNQSSSSSGSGVGGGGTSGSGGSGFGALGSTLGAVADALTGGSGSVFPSNGISTFWLNGFEYQNWTESNGKPMYDMYLSPGSDLASDNFMSRLIYNADAYNRSECALLTVTVSATGAKDANLTAAPCTSLASIVCRSASSCAEPPIYPDGYLSGVGWYNLTSTALVVDILTTNCTELDPASTSLDSSVYYACKAPVPGSLSAVIPVVFSTCQMSAGAMNWSQLSNTSSCRSSQCDLRRLFSMADVDNQRFLRLTQNGSVTWNNWLVANRTQVEATCLPGAALVPANDSFSSQYGVASSVYCFNDAWIFNVSYFCNATTLAVEPIEQPIAATPLYRCRRVRCPVSDLLNSSAINTTGLDPGAYMEVGESLQLACNNASDPMWYFPRPLLRVQCLLYNNISYKFAVTFADTGSPNASTSTNGSVNILRSDMSNRCISQAMRSCNLTEDILNQRHVIATNASEVGWQYPRKHDDYMPPNSSIVIACNTTRVNSKTMASIGQSYNLFCRPDGELRVYFQDYSNYNTSLDIKCAYETCPTFSTPPRTEVAGVRDTAGANWTMISAAILELAPGYQLLVRCALAPDAFQIVVCNDTGRVWMPLASSDNRSLWQGQGLINCTGLGEALRIVNRASYIFRLVPRIE